VRQRAVRIVPNTAVTVRLFARPSVAKMRTKTRCSQTLRNSELRSPLTAYTMDFSKNLLLDS